MAISFNDFNFVSAFSVCLVKQMAINISCSKFKMLLSCTLGTKHHYMQDKIDKKPESKCI